jgi:hypothetical protein
LSIPSAPSEEHQEHHRHELNLYAIFHLYSGLESSKIQICLIFKIFRKYIFRAFTLFLKSQNPIILLFFPRMGQN